MSKHHPRPVEKPAASSPVPAGAWWNGIRRLWLVQTAAGIVPLDPQPAPPAPGQVVALYESVVRPLRDGAGVGSIGVRGIAVLPGPRIDL